VIPLESVNADALIHHQEKKNLIGNERIVAMDLFKIMAKEEREQKVRSSRSGR
jgi:hypothetical protein